VQHAHQKGVIHRDLKPSNVLVGLYDGLPVPKVIDFGVAKAVGQPLTEQTLVTGFGNLVGTLEYMSPEQAEINQLDIDTRSDIYSLGVLLYELLAGSPPFSRTELEHAGMLEMLRVIREQEPTKPSTKLSTAEGLPGLAANRGTEPARLTKLVRGDLDWIVMRCLEKDRNRRYETANALAADVIRYLSDRPVEACPPSAWYRFKKYARRHRAALTTAAVVALALVTSTAVSAWQAAQARRAGAEARRRTEESRQVVDYLVNDIFGSVAPEKTHGHSLTVLDLLNDADANLAERFADQPLVEASVRMALARAYHFVWDYDHEIKNAARAAELRERSLGPEHLETLDALEAQARGLIMRSQADESKVAEPLARRAFLGRRRQLGAGHRDALASQFTLAGSLAFTGRAAEALPMFTEAEAIAARRYGAMDPLTIKFRRAIGGTLYRYYDPERGQAVVRQVAADLERVLGAMHPETIHTLNDLGRASVACGRLDEGRAAYLKALDASVRLFGPTHREVQSVLNGLDLILRQQGDFPALRDVGEGLIREVLATPADPGQFQRDRRSIQLSICVRILTSLPDQITYDTDLVRRAVAALESNVQTAEGLNSLAWLLATSPRLGNPAGAVELARKAVEAEPGSGSIWKTLGVAYYRAGDWVTAIEALEKAEALGQNAQNGFCLAMAHWQLGDKEKAREWYDKAVAWMENFPKNQPLNVQMWRFRAEAEELLELNEKK
jgi:non-specific serine/threonine protein kinase/serine/threonine-protein kinase